ncbi:hypothetical protein DUI87_26772 [Hirundo rustica rustica]|uniref:glutathione peroxidase n=1 Tax=Hirundo rustica rustica TaxID=333673 RepID=A0A3M0J6I8_HIRRU|nr:hypothetical protein DUI87_26772 [Hirundo rustica rustica]
MGGCSRSSWILPLFLAGLVQLGRSEEREKVDCYPTVNDTIYSYGALTLDGDEYIPFERYVRPGGGFVPNFQLFKKGDVNGAKEQKIFTFLKNACPPVAEEFGNPNKLFWEPLRNHDIKWNFEKFLVSPEGVPIMRWYHRTNIAAVKNHIVTYLRQRQQGKHDE